MTLLLLSFGIEDSKAWEIERITLQQGETIDIQPQNLVALLGGVSVISDGSIVDYEYKIDASTSSSYEKLTGLKPGTTTMVSISTKTFNVLRCYVITVVGVKTITIPSSISLTTGEQYKYSPIITDAEAITTLTWSSSNTAVATVGDDGTVSAIGPGNTTITCTAANGVKTQGVVNVAPLLTSKVTLNTKNCEMNVGDVTLLTPTVLPANVTNKQVNWVSGNDNIAQVDDEGNVTAIGPGYCSIYCFADDGSGKHAKCLVHVLGDGTTATVRGDMNGDGKVTPADAIEVLYMYFGVK